jgi:RNA polymerase sigma-70 factor (sigma-E family)
MTTAGNDTATSREDDLLARAYQQAIGAQADQYAVAYDLSAGLMRFTNWLQDHAAADLDADQAVARLYSLHYQPLLRLATLLVRDATTGEAIVSDAFVAMHDGWPRLRDADKALAYLRQAVVNRSRTVLRHRRVTSPNLQEAPPDTPNAEHRAQDLLDQPAAVAVLRGLPERQREAIVLRFYGNLPEDQIAAAMGISRGAVKSHISRGLSALRAVLEQATSQQIYTQPSTRSDRPAAEMIARLIAEALETDEADLRSRWSQSWSDGQRKRPPDHLRRASPGSEGGFVPPASGL